MRRYSITKASNPLKIRPITQPAEVYLLVMTSLSLLLHLVFDPTFSNCSHGFLVEVRSPF